MVVKLLKVAPIIKGISKELSYFSIKNVQKGALISIEMRKKEIPAIVLSAEEVGKTKTQLKQSPFLLKRITRINSKKFLNSNFINAVEKTATYFVCGTGAITKELCPQIILENSSFFEPTSLIDKDKKSSSKKHTISALCAPQKERIRFYKNTIRSEFAKNNSIFLCLASTFHMEKFENELKKGIEKFVFSFHAKMGKKELKEKLKKIKEEKHPILIISTSLFLALAQETNTIIVENESSDIYKSNNRPFLDARKVIENISVETQKNLILADQIVRTETYQKIQSGKISLATPLSSKVVSDAQQLLVDLKDYKIPISDELKEMLVSAYKKNEQTILFINRRGHGLSTVCNDCGNVILCSKCDTPLVLHKKTANIFVCHKCFEETKASNKCPYCGSWKLKTLGSGIQKITEEIQQALPDYKIFQLDSDVAKTKKQGAEIVKNFTESPGSILVTTELLFSFFQDTVDRICVISIDGLLNIPSFRINKKIFQTLLHLKTMARKTFLIQTRIPKNPIFTNIMKGDISEFYKNELEARKTFGYPPFKTLIKIIREGKDKPQIQKEIKDLEKTLENYNPISFAAFVPKVKNLYQYCILLKLDAETWPNKHKELHNVLSSLSPQWKIDVDPESLL